MPFNPSLPGARIPKSPNTREERRKWTHDENTIAYLWSWVIGFRDQGLGWLAGTGGMEKKKLETTVMDSGLYRVYCLAFTLGMEKKMELL